MTGIHRYGHAVAPGDLVMPIKPSHMGCSGGYSLMGRVLVVDSIVTGVASCNACGMRASVPEVFVVFSNGQGYRIDHVFRIHTLEEIATLELRKTRKGSK